jgi:mediator of RNA polymerase II transcription subunit 12, fungi type
VDPKATSYNPFSNYPEIELKQLPVDMPSSYRVRIRTLLPFVAPNASVADLAYISKDGSMSPIPVQNRPWEWIEYLGERSAHEAKDDDTPDGVLKNAASLSLDLFDTHALARRPATIAGENAVVKVGRQNAQRALSMLEETMFTESVFKRDWRESRTFASSLSQDASEVQPEAEDEIGPLPNFTATDRRSNSSRMASPVSSVRSRASVQPMIPSVIYQSPAHPQQQRISMSGSSASDAIDVDSLNFDVSHPASSLPMQGSNKRKATEDVDHDDADNAQKKQQGKGGSAKPRPKKR